MSKRPHHLRDLIVGLGIGLGLSFTTPHAAAADPRAAKGEAVPLPRLGIAETTCAAHRIRVIAEAMANSLSALAMVTESNVRAIEIDVHMLADGTWIVYHNHRIAGRSLHRMTIEDVRGYHLPNGEILPMMNQILSRVRTGPPIEVVVEFKDRPNPDAIAALVVAFDDRPDLLTIISFSRRHLQRAKELLPDSMRKRGTRLLHLGLTPIGLSRSFDGVNVKTIRGAAVRHLVEEGQFVAIWGNTSPGRRLGRLVAAGVRMITTDEAAACVAWIGAQGLALRTSTDHQSGSP